MQDTIIKGTGNSRTLKGPPNLLATYPTWQDAAQAIQDGTFPIDLGPLNPLGLLQTGTGYTKADVLPADLQASLSLPDSATPADAYKALYRSIYGSDQVIYRWSRTRPKYVETRTKISTVVNIANPQSVESIVSIKVADSVNINPINGAFSLSSPIIVSHEAQDWKLSGNYSAIRNKYIQVVESSSPIYKCNSSATIDLTFNNAWLLRLSAGSFLVSSAPSTTEQITEIVTSTDPNAYPVAGDGWTYTELTPVPTMQPCARTQIGSYVGTGTYGENNPNSLTFEFEPKLLVIVGIQGYPTSSKTSRSFAWISAEGMGFGVYPSTNGNSFSGKYIFSSVDEKTINWSSSSEGFQQNLVTTTYFYTAIG